MSQSHRNCRAATHGRAASYFRIGKRWGTRSVLALLLFISSTAAANGPRQVLLLLSSEREFTPFDTFTSDFKTELNRTYGKPVNFLEVLLQPPPSGDQTEQPLADQLETMLGDRRIDLVVPVGGAAATFAQKYRASLFPETPLLLAAVDERDLQSTALTAKDSVAAVRNEPAAALDNILQVLPQTRTIYVILGNSSLEQFWRKQAESKFQRFAGRVHVVWPAGLSFAELIDLCAALPPDSAIFYVLFSVDSNGVSYSEGKVLGALHAVANAPIFGLRGTQIGRGIVGGPLMAPDQVIRNAAGQATRILEGEASTNIPDSAQTPAPPVYDWRELRRWNISENRLPAGSIVDFREPSLWDRNKWSIAGGIIIASIQAALIIGLLASVAHRKRAERRLQHGQDRMAAIIGACDEGILTFNSNGIVETVNPAAEKIFAVSTQQIVGRHLAEFIPACSGVGRELASRVLTLKDVGGQRSGGSELHLEVSVSEIGVDDGRLFTAFIRNITERKRLEDLSRDIGMRLVRAQEAERARLARELHDDVTQRLARLAMDAAKANHLQDRGEAIGALREGLVRLSEDVHSLAYKLHPAMLERLGLTRALKGESERFQQQESIPVAVNIQENLPAIPQDAALCLFRVTQEALRNIARHAHAGSAQISLLLVHGGLQLLIADNGIGFDINFPSPRPSLGLSNMRERVRLLGGTLELESMPERGTTLRAWIPLASLWQDSSTSKTINVKGENESTSRVAG